jgi:hypothetical protein
MLTNICLIRMCIQIIMIQRSHRSSTARSTWWSSWRKRHPSIPVKGRSIVLSAVDLLVTGLWLLSGIRWRSSKQGHITTHRVRVNIVVTNHPSRSLHRRRPSSSKPNGAACKGKGTAPLKFDKDDDDDFMPSDWAKKASSTKGKRVVKP